MGDNQVSRFGYWNDRGGLEAWLGTDAGGTSTFVLPFGTCRQRVSIIRQGRQKSAKTMGARSYRHDPDDHPFWFTTVSSEEFPLLALTLDMAVPPLTLLGMMVSLTVLASGLGVLLGLPYTALSVSAASLSAYLIAVTLCWLRFGRDILPLSSISSMISYVGDKLPLYRQMLSRDGGSQWIRTDREKSREDTN